MLTPNSPTHLIRFIRQDFPKMGATVPAAFTTALNTIDTTYDMTGKLPSRTDPQTRRDLAAATVAAVAAGRDLATDPAILEILTKRQILAAGLDGLVEEHVEGLRRGVIVDYGDELIAALGAAFDAAATQVQAARDTIGADVDLTHTAAVSRVPAAHMTLWGQAYEATQRIAMIGKYWEMIATHTRMVDAVQDLMRPLIAADLTAEQLAGIPGVRRPMVGAVLAGFPLDMATPAEFIQRCQRVRDEWAAGAPMGLPHIYQAVDRGQVVTVAG
ncbi:hypothetical protein [Nocardia cyriacigeorgica]|uniref:hypothetical protein n=1 Tax=Nocardia cyriacigeorgica TaxID=135487 RepID=UPI002456F1DF|nr:hypothetical protein [Nocardia cyriacigeorgica]